METINLNQLASAIKMIRSLSESFNEEDQALVNAAEKEISSLRKGVEKQLNQEASLLEEKFEESRKTTSWHRAEIEGIWQKNEEWVMSVELYLVRKYGFKYKRAFSFPETSTTNDTVETLRKKIYDLISVLEKE